MTRIRLTFTKLRIALISITLAFSTIHTNAQSYAEWYENAQEQIDTLRKGDFAFQIENNDGQAYSGPVSVRMAKHEFPFGIAFDFYEGSSMGNSYTSQETVSADTDAEIYQTEQWGDYLAYDFVVIIHD